MKRFAIGWISLLFGTLGAGVGLAADKGGSRFVISIDPKARAHWEFRYPVTCVFRLASIPVGVEVKRRDGSQGTWTVLPEKTVSDSFQGIPCVRFDRPKGLALVSVGFGATSTVELEFRGASGVKFDRFARYYDDRKAAYSLSIDNWGWRPTARPGASWKGPTSDESDKYQAALAVCRSFHLPVSIAVNSGSAGGEAMWRTMQEELDRQDFSWEPAVHARSHPSNAAAYQVQGCKAEILGCRDDLLGHLHNIPYGQHVFEHILTSGYYDETILATDEDEFLFVRGFNGRDNPSSCDFAPWDAKRRFYGPGGRSTKDYDAVFARRVPKGRYFGRDVAELNEAFDQVYRAGQVFYALWHPDRYQNSVLYDPRPGADGVQGSTLVQHLAHVARHKDAWCVANGWLYCYRYVVEHGSVRETAGRE